mgnify:CR=1 FL=1
MGGRLGHRLHRAHDVVWTVTLYFTLLPLRFPFQRYDAPSAWGFLLLSHNGCNRGHLCKLQIWWVQDVGAKRCSPVSYTHLPLPTILLV